LFDVVFSGSTRLKQIKFASKHEHEFIHNFKLLQNSFKKMGVDKVNYQGGKYKNLPEHSTVLYCIL
jgi:hypothetical protein